MRPSLLRYMTLPGFGPRTKGVAPRSDDVSSRLIGRVFEASCEGIFIASRERQILAANQAFATLSGYTIAQLTGMTVARLRAPSMSVDAVTEIQRDVCRTGHGRREVVGRTRLGEDQHVELSIVRILDESNNKYVYIYTCRDITERQRAEARMRHAAYFDVLTGLPNRSRLNAAFPDILAVVRTGRRKLAVVFLDLDGFKGINDTLGHSAGDAMIHALAQRISASMPKESLVCRFGGDEFVLVLPGSDETKAHECVDALLERVSNPVWLEGREVAVTASAGISVYPKDGTDAESLIRHADTALYHAKAKGKNMAVAFDLDMDVALSRRFELLNALRSALQHQQFGLRFQPIVDVHSGMVVGAEALVYWNHPQFGVIGPSTFIALAEESGLIESLGEWVMDEAFHHYGIWRAAGLEPIYLAINVSGFQLRRLEKLQAKISEAVGSGVIDADRIVLEITERHVVHDVETCLPILRALSNDGVGLAIDDFGTGYSNLGYLKELPITQIKIDMSFVQGLVSNAGDRAIVKSIIDLARNLQVSVVAEGVETLEQLAILREYGCTKVQGFLFARPLAPEALIKFVVDARIDTSTDVSNINASGHSENCLSVV